ANAAAGCYSKKRGQFSAPDFATTGSCSFPNTCIIPDNRMVYHSFEEVNKKTKDFEDPQFLF
ncbi:MAG: hypothetical protein LBK13_02040, partial [Spirochaetales bacterium]|nr:hypothetical protein [Spirochaetales bacterium]